MTPEEYLERRKELAQRHEQEVYKLASQYALSQSDVWFGDIISDDIGEIVVEKIDTIDHLYDLPRLMFTGRVLNGRASRSIHELAVKNHTKETQDD